MSYRPIPMCINILRRFIIGNMGNPVITRLGKTQFWYKNYNPDFQYSTKLKTYKTFEYLIKVYFSYGLLNTNVLFFNNFWYKNTVFKTKTTLIGHKKNNIHYRKYYYSHQTLTIEHSYFKRLKTPEFFPLKLYLLCYNNWVILSIQWFKPVKKLNLNSTAALSLNSTTKFNKPIISKSENNYKKSSKRLQIIYYLLRKHYNYQSKYSF